MGAYILPIESTESHIWIDGLPDIARGYIESAFFCGVTYVFPDPDGETQLCDGTRGRCEELDGVGPANLDAESREALEAQAGRFWIANAETLAAALEIDGAGYSLEQAGIDFWFSRNGHGVGFLDRGLDVLGETLQAAAMSAGEVDLYAEPLEPGAELGRAIDRLDALEDSRAEGRFIDAAKADVQVARADYRAGETLESVDLEALEADGWRVALDCRENPLTDAERATLAALEAGGIGGAALPLPDVGGLYGAPMGRRSDVLDPAEPMTLRRVTLDSGGYDSGGAYWGLGEPLWRAEAADDSTAYFRAESRADALEMFKQGEAA